MRDRSQHTHHHLGHLKQWQAIERVQDASSMASGMAEGEGGGGGWGAAGEGGGGRRKEGALWFRVFCARGSVETQSEKTTGWASY